MSIWARWSYDNAQTVLFVISNVYVLIAKILQQIFYVLQDGETKFLMRFYYLILKIARVYKGRRKKLINYMKAYFLAALSVNK